MLILRIDDKLLIKETKVVFLHQLVALLNKFWFFFFFQIKQSLGVLWQVIFYKMVLVTMPRAQYARDISVRIV